MLQNVPLGSWCAGMQHHPGKRPILDLEFELKVSAGGVEPTVGCVSGLAVRGLQGAQSCPLGC